MFARFSGFLLLTGRCVFTIRLKVHRHFLTTKRASKHWQPECLSVWWWLPFVRLFCYKDYPFIWYLSTRDALMESYRKLS